MDVASKRLRRLPTYMLGTLRSRTLERRREGADVIDLGMGNPDLRTPQPVIDKLCEAAQDVRNHRYSQSKGVYNLRREIAWHYERRFGVDLDPEHEAVAVIGTKEGLCLLALGIIDEGDVAIIPDPTYPIHMYSIVTAGGSVISVPLREENDFVPSLAKIVQDIYPKPKLLVLSFPHNPTGAVVDLAFFEEVVHYARRHNILVVHDLAYADLAYDGYAAPSILQVEGAKEIAVEFYSLSKSHSMAGWRIGFAVGNRDILSALSRIKSYYDYGIFAPVQIAAIMALRTEEHILKETVNTYRTRRDVLVESMARIGWEIPSPKATIFAWAPIPEAHREAGSMAFATKMLEEADVCVSPGVGFGAHGEGFVRIALVENENRIRQAVRQMKRVLDP
ncbi:aminotransferase class I/II-fold pyridoxal phosphate-dependent enzyme [Candidatus Poribacteria bacterium]|jgi:alanine-synthesizing transaminase|nr:aminotransferase class I/II-fold pyridoxal phosphate-dependent enzyme [Candidatus Poribacteria bacterium]MBT5536476.1 aminotransferase class I/II-fold pyridoxal phosphate-dependent enzyme [Candidatus Poribacteria bacterium]MBT5714887.1 aminotransferase class I/II-fold pyridoxal phosphate-dependent enzyme [Candidatus Poribacteria bacterium]MBT7806710.1 aminotransferase class I/II-fold pyridoxal phosphate-dependent enzyme [Candidatus Poribacteria bacterium]